jgi:hypothetical protein
MHGTSPLRALRIGLFCAATTVACGGMDDLGPSEGALSVADWSDAEPPVGRLCGRVYDLPLETRSLPADFGAFHPVEALCADRLAVSTRNGPPGFPGVRGRFEWFGVDFQGVVSVGQPGQINFRLTSDDGAKLAIDGVVVLNNDGYHAVRTVEGTVELAAGQHRFSIPYWQGPGPMALVLEEARPGESYQILRADRVL